MGEGNREGEEGAAEPESKQLNERVSGEEEKLLYIIGGEGRGKAASASGQRLANDAYHGSPCEDSLGYFNDCIYIPGAAARQTEWKDVAAASPLAAQRRPLEGRRERREEEKNVSEPSGLIVDITLLLLSV